MEKVIIRSKISAHPSSNYVNRHYKNEAKKNRRIAEYSLDADDKRTYSHRAEVFEQKAAAVKKLQTEKENESGFLIP